MRISWHSSSIIHTRQDSYVPIFYFELAKRYGDIPLITTLLSEEEANMQKRTSFDEVIQFIVDECDAIAPHLPISYKELIKKRNRACNKRRSNGFEIKSFTIFSKSIVQ